MIRWWHKVSRADLWRDIESVECFSSEPKSCLFAKQFITSTLRKDEVPEVVEEKAVAEKKDGADEKDGAEEKDEAEKDGPTTGRV